MLVINHFDAPFVTRHSQAIVLLKYTREKLYQLNKCDPAIYGKSDIISCIRTYAGEKSFKCGYCNFFVENCVSIYIYIYILR